MSSAVAVHAAFWATVLAAPPAVLLGWWLARRPLPFLLEALAWAPLVVPPGLVGGGVVGGDIGTGAVLGFPLGALAARAAFERVGPRWARLARTLGDTRAETFARVDLPLAFPGVLGVTALVFARAVSLSLPGLPAAIPALLVAIALARAHRAALEAAGA
jgi:molybdate transport system permease protein